MRFVRGECGCEGVALDKPDKDIDGTSWHYIYLLRACSGDMGLAYEQAVRNPVDMTAVEALALVTQVATAAHRGIRALSALRSLQSEMDWARDTTPWGS